MYQFSVPNPNLFAMNSMFSRFSIYDRYPNVESASTAISYPVVQAVSTMRINSMTHVIDAKKFAVEEPPLYMPQIFMKETDGQIICVNGFETVSWIKHIDLAPDTSFINVLLEATVDGVILKIVKTIRPGEGLYLWFSQHCESIIRLPSTIHPTMLLAEYSKQPASGQIYVCNKCGSQFLYPNIMKLHMFMSCNITSVNSIWRSLAANFDKKFYSFDPCLQQSTNPQSLPAFPAAPWVQQPIALMPCSSTLPTNPMPNPPTLPFNVSRNVDPNCESFLPILGEQHRGCSSAFKLPRPENVGNEALVFYHSIKNSLSPRQRGFYINQIINCLVNQAFEEDKVFYCPICRAGISRRYGLKIHMRTHFEHKPEKCRHCDRIFPDPSNRNKHEHNIHKVEGPYKCSECKKTMKRERDLTKHIANAHKKHCVSEVEDRDLSRGNALDLRTSEKV